LLKTVVNVGVKPRDDRGVEGRANGRNGYEVVARKVLKYERQDVKV
jgi:hypothetical protein